MSFTTPCFIRKNTPELRDKLKELGYRVCSCTTSKTAIYLMVGYEGIHAVSDEVVDVFEDEVKAGILKSIDCGDDENLFIALAALRDDTNHNQWFTNGKEWIIYMDNTDKGGLSCFQYFAMPRDINLENFHKATSTEIIAHFKQKES